MSIFVQEEGESNIKYKKITPLLHAIIINILALCILSQCHIEAVIKRLTVIFLVTTTEQLAFYRGFTLFNEHSNPCLLLMANSTTREY